MSYCYSDTSFDEQGKPVSSAEFLEFRNKEFSVETYKQWLYLRVTETNEGVKNKIFVEEYPDYYKHPGNSYREFYGFKIYAYKSSNCLGFCAVIQNPDLSWWFTSGYYDGDDCTDEQDLLEEFLYKSKFFEEQVNIPNSIKTTFKQLIKEHIERP
jgi:hypothetical protein